MAELIAAPGKGALNLAQARLGGGLGRKIQQLRAIIKDVCAKLCLAVDFPEEDLECLPSEELLSVVESAHTTVDELLAAFVRTRAWREGALVVIAGEVNAGKSSLLNTLVGKNRAIVTDIPGTTRDYLEEGIDLDGLPVRLVDTAGLRNTEDAVELAGLRMGKELAERADLVLLVVDRSSPVPEEATKLAASIGVDRMLGVVNKLDVPEHETGPEQVLRDMGLDICLISAKTGDGVLNLAREVRARVLGVEQEPDPDEVAPNARQADALRRAGTELEAIIQDVALNIPYDLLGTRLDQVMACLDEITGRITPEEVLNDIFDNFCIGK